MSKSLKILILAGALAASAGAADTPPTPRQIAPPTRIPDIETLTPLPAGEPVSTAQIPRAVRRAVVTDAAKRFNVAESAVVLARAEQLTWSDGSLGCPEPGRMYTQMLVAGFRVVATTGAGALTYHTDSRGIAVTCLASPAGGHGHRSFRPHRCRRPLAAGSLNGSASIGSPAADWPGRISLHVTWSKSCDSPYVVSHRKLPTKCDAPVFLRATGILSISRSRAAPARAVVASSPSSPAVTSACSLLSARAAMTEASWLRARCSSTPGTARRSRVWGFPTRCARCRSPSKRASQAVA